MRAEGEHTIWRWPLDLEPPIILHSIMSLLIPLVDCFVPLLFIIPHYPPAIKHGKGRSSIWSLWIPIATFDYRRLLEEPFQRRKRVPSFTVVWYFSSNSCRQQEDQRSHGEKSQEIGNQPTEKGDITNNDCIGLTGNWLKLAGLYRCLLDRPPILGLACKIMMNIPSAKNDTEVFACRIHKPTAAVTTSSLRETTVRWASATKCGARNRRKSQKCSSKHILSDPKKCSFILVSEIWSEFTNLNLNEIPIWTIR